MPGEVFPYLVPVPGTVHWGGWELQEEDVWIALPAELEGWTPGTDLVLRRTVRVDPVALTAQTFLEPDEVRITTSWTSSTTDMTDACTPVALSGDGYAVLQFTVDGSQVSGVLSLRTTLALRAPARTAEIGAARIPGSVLDEDRQQVALENSPAMFPVHEVDFSGTRLPYDASWHLETTSDLDAPFLGTFQLLLNTRDRELCSAVRKPKDKRQLALCDELQAGVAMLMLEIAVKEREELTGRTWGAETVGHVLLQLLRNAGMENDVHPDTAGTARFRTRVADAVRRSGQGRQFM